MFSSFFVYIFIIALNVKMQFNQNFLIIYVCFFTVIIENKQKNLVA